MHPLLDRGRPRTDPGQPLFSGEGAPVLPLARLHEACGPARHTLAAWLAGAVRDGPVIWAHPGHGPDAMPLCPEGLSEWVDPARFLFVAADRPGELLWVMEETLRAGVAGLVVGDLPGPPGLVAVRRLHLAAETGRAEGAGRVPLGLILTPEGAAPAVETRWSMGWQPDGVAWRLERLRARTAPPKTWRIGRRTPAGQSGPATLRAA